MSRTTFPILPVLTLALASFLVAGPAGCAASGDAAAPATDIPPPDFTLSVTTMSQVNRREPAPTRERRPARFVMETDWVLRAFTGRQPVGHDTFPNETRQLDAAEVASLWSDLRAAGLLDPDHPATVGAAPAPSEVAPGAPVWVITYSAAGDRHTVVLDADPASPAAPLINRLADLAWIPK